MNHELSDKQIKMLKALADKPDEEIDYSDIPSTEAKDWQQAKAGEFYRPVKKQVTIRLDADVLMWLRSGGKGYQTRINQILRHAMLSS